MPKTILVADDSRTMQEVVRLVLHRQGYDLVSCESGRRALQLAREIQPNLVLADLRMPDGDGSWLTEQLRTDPRLARTPVLLFYPASEPLSEDVQRKIGASAALAKPFLSSELSEQCRQLLGPPREQKRDDRVQRAEEAAAAGARAVTPSGRARAASSNLAERISRMEEVLGRRGGAASGSETIAFGGPKATPEPAAPADENAVLDALRQAGRAFQRTKPGDGAAAMGTAARSEASTKPGRTASFRSFSSPRRPSEPPAPATGQPVQGPPAATAVSGYADRAQARQAEAGTRRITPPRGEEPVSTPFTARQRRRTREAEELPSAPQEEHRPLTREDLLDAVRQIAREAVERAVWEMVPDIAEKILWEIIPEISESLVREFLQEQQKKL
ncbi:MAG: response regulator [Deltaproteobacteria bacterium]|nr:response regulator [Deltaproteobacteria bacterium]